MGYNAPAAYQAVHNRLLPRLRAARLALLARAGQGACRGGLHPLSPAQRKAHRLTSLFTATLKRRFGLPGGRRSGS